MANFPSELFPSLLPRHEEAAPTWDAFCGWGSLGAVNIDGPRLNASGGNRARVVMAQQSFASGAADELVALGPSVPFYSPGACAWQSRWSSQELLVTPLRKARRTICVKNATIRHWIGNAEASASTRARLHSILKETRAQGSASPPLEIDTELGDHPLFALPRPLAELISQGANLFAEASLPKANYSVAGGCIKCSWLLPGQSQGAPAVLLASAGGINFQSLNFQHISLDRDPADDAVMQRHGYKSVQLTSAVRQVELRNYEGEDSSWCGVRCDDGSCVFYNVALANFDDSTPLHRISTSSAPSTACHMCLSPYWHGEWLTASADCRISRWSATSDVECEQTVVVHGGELRRRLSASTAGCMPQVHYGSHPRLIVATNSEAVASLDLRCPGGAPCELFAVPSRLLHRGELLVASQQLSVECPFYHCILADHSWLLVDERFPRHPLLCCAVPSSSPATYIDTSLLRGDECKNNSEQILTVGCQEALEAYCYGLRVGDHAPSLTSRPWKVGSIRDFAYGDAGSARPLPTEAAVVERRLGSAALAGVTSVATASPSSLGNHPTSLTVFQLTSFGDIFVQDYVPRHAAVGRLRDESNPEFSAGLTGATGRESHLKLSSASVSACNKWTKALVAQSDWVAAESRKRDSDAGESHASACNLLGAISDAWCLRPHIACSLCSRQDRAVADDAAGTSEDICYSCTLSLGAASEFVQSVSTDTIIQAEAAYDAFIGETILFDAERFTDPNSQLHIKLWKGDDITESLLARDEHWRVLREERQARLGKERSKQSENQHDVMSQEDRGSREDVMSMCSRSTYTSRQSKLGARPREHMSTGSVAASDGFLHMTKRTNAKRFQEPATAKQDGTDDVLEPLPFTFLSQSTQEAALPFSKQTPSKQERSRNVKRVEGFC